MQTSQTFCRILHLKKQTVAAAAETVDRASDTVDVHASSHVLSAVHSALRCAVVSKVLAAAAPMFFQRCAVARLNYYALI